MRRPSLILWATLLSAPSWAQGVFGTWKIDLARSRFGESDAGSITVRIEPHAKGEVFTYERVRKNGRVEVFSVILHLDGKEHDSRYDGRPAAQVSRRLDSRTVETVWKCSDGRVVRVVRRMPPDTHDLVMDWSENPPDAPGVEKHLVLKQQASKKESR